MRHPLKLSNILDLSWNLVPRLLWICRIQWWFLLFSVLDQKISGKIWETSGKSLGKFGPKNQNCQFKLKFGTKTNLNMENSMVAFTLAVLDWEFPFWENLIQAIKVVSLSWNLVPKLILICRIKWGCSLFPFSTGNTLFGQIWVHNTKLSLKLKSGT